MHPIHEAAGGPNSRTTGTTNDQAERAQRYWSRVADYAARELDAAGLVGPEREDGELLVSLIRRGAGRDA